MNLTGEINLGSLLVGSTNLVALGLTVWKASGAYRSLKDGQQSNRDAIQEVKCDTVAALGDIKRTLGNGEPGMFRRVTTCEKLHEDLAEAVTVIRDDVREVRDLVTRQ